MDLASAQTAFQITAPTGVTGTFTWSNGGATMTFNPAADFANGTVVNFQVNMAAKDAAGNMKTTVDSYQFTVIRRGTATFTSEPAVDGYWFSTPMVNSNAVTFTAGDTAANLYYQGYLSFGLNLPGVTAATEAQTTDRHRHAADHADLDGGDAVHDPRGAALRARLLRTDAGHG